ncbi:MAG: hypothetical protein MZV64_19575 [Ignavibacteriales bacterium]|nr:hypothetical protein [Ignavibacteriales bacterium]
MDEVQFTRDYTFSTEGQLLYRQATGRAIAGLKSVDPDPIGRQQGGCDRSG